MRNLGENPGTSRGLARKAALSAGLAALLTLGATAMQALAGIAAAPPEMTCIRYAGSADVIRNATGGVIANLSDRDSLFVFCPVVRRSESRLVSASWVGVVDEHPHQDVTCRLWTIYLHGTGGFSGSMAPWSRSSGFGPALQILETGRPPYANALSHYFFECEVPPAFGGSTSLIVSYAVSEDD